MDQPQAVQPTEVPVVDTNPALVEVATQEPQFKWQFPTGTVYRDDAELSRGVVEKDMTIAKLKASLDTMRQQQYQPQSAQLSQNAQSQGPPPQLVQAELSKLQRRFPNTEIADLQAMAEHNVEEKLELKRSILGEIQGMTQSQKFESQYEQYRAAELKNGIDLNSDPTYDQVFTELKGQSPEVHYAVYKQRVAKLGNGVSPGLGVSAAYGQGNRVINSGSVNGSSSPVAGQPGVGASHPYVQQRVDQAIAAGKSPASVDIVRKLAMDNLPNVIKSGAKF